MASPASIVWTRNMGSYGNTGVQYNSVCYGNDLYIAVGSGGAAVRSTDGMTWTLCDTPSGILNTWQSVCVGLDPSGNNLFVAVSTDWVNRVMRSSDGITWTVGAAADENAGWRSVCYGNGVFIAVAQSGTAGRIMTSTNGITWTLTSSNVTFNSTWQSICYGSAANNAFVAVASSGTNRIITSTNNGSTWTVQTAPALPPAYGSIVYGVYGGSYAFTIAVVGGSASSTITFASNSITLWQTTTTATDLRRGLCYGADSGGNSVLIALGSQTSYYSSNGTTSWTTFSNNYPHTATYYSLCFNNSTNTMVAVSSVATGMISIVLPLPNLTSPQWIDSTISPNDLNSGSGCCKIDGSGNATYVMVLTNGYMIYSTNATTWNLATSPSSLNAWQSVDYGNGVFVAVANSGTNRVATSTDGITWTFQPSTVADIGNWRSICYAELDGGSTKMFVAVTNSGTNRVMVSTNNGVTWTGYVGANSSWVSVCYGNGAFVAVSSTSGTTNVMRSTNGTSWSVITAPTSNSRQSVCYGSRFNRFVACSNTGTNNRFMYSDDLGLTWTTCTQTNNSTWTSISYGNGMYVAVNSTNSTTTNTSISDDGITWYDASSPAAAWYSVFYGGSRFVSIASVLGNSTMSGIGTPSCFHESARILCLSRIQSHELAKKQNQDQYIPITKLRPGDWVKTYKHGYRRIAHIGKNQMANNPKHWYQSMYQLINDKKKKDKKPLMVTGGHGILVDEYESAEQQRQNDELHHGKAPCIDGKYILLVCLSSRFQVVSDADAIFTYYHFTLELEDEADEHTRYGVWAATGCDNEGILTETPSKLQYFAHSYSAVA